MNPVTKELRLEYCVDCGYTLHEDFCMQGCVYDGTLERPVESVKVAVYVLSETL